MKKKLLLSVAAAVTVLSSSIPVCAAPQYMADGAVFDPEWYQEQNPEVAEALKSLGLDVSADTLYLHYTLFGANERRTPYDEAHFDLASVLPYQGAGAEPESAAQTQPAASQTQSDDSEKIIAVEGETYRFPSIHSSKYNYADCMVNVTFNRGEVDEDEEYGYFADYLAAYTLPGYEWRMVSVSATTDASVPGGTTLMDIDGSKRDFLRVQSYNCDDTIVTSHDSLWDYIDENGWVLHAATFTVSQNGVEYPNCQLFETWDFGINDYYYFSWYALVPKNFSGGLYAGYCGRTLENGEVVVDKSSPHILFEF